MKIVFLFIMLQLAAGAVFAQKLNAVNSQKDTFNPFLDKREYKGYLIKLKISGQSQFGFDILKTHSPQIIQIQNPLAFSSKGVQKKEDAYKIAQWIIGEYEKTGHWEHTVPPHIVKRLGIDLN
jgi:hypothetical protein